MTVRQAAHVIYMTHHQPRCSGR